MGSLWTKKWTAIHQKNFTDRKYGGKEQSYQAAALFLNNLIDAVKAPGKHSKKLSFFDSISAFHMCQFDAKG